MATNQQDDERVVKIGCASGFWGDTNTAAFQLVHLTDINYLVFDYLVRNHHVDYGNSENGRTETWLCFGLCQSGDGAST